MSSRDLTGRWDGIFNYPRTLPPTGFVAVLVEQGGALTGMIEEIGRDADAPDATLASVIEGERVGGTVRFTKRYDDLARAHYAIRYDGAVTPDGDEITGEWTIPGVWSGTFIMVRETGVSAAVAGEDLASAAADPPALTPPAAAGGSTSRRRSPPSP